MAQNVKFGAWICHQANSLIQKIQYSQNWTFFVRDNLLHIFFTIITVMPYKLKKIQNYQFAYVIGNYVTKNGLKKQELLYIGSKN